MCAIYGMVELNKRDRRPRPSRGLAATLEEMGKALAHRGPDDQGAYVEQNAQASVAIGMRRLSIIDLEGGYQPITNEDGSLVAVCNGEIYNYRELRAELTGKGHVFRSQSDVEVLVHLYEEHGWECVTKLRGMFAFAIWDAKQRTLVLGRDRIGIKPLFVHEGRERIAFASEVRGLWPALEERPALSHSALLRLLILQYVPGPETAFKQVKKLMPGTVMLVTERGSELRRYWRPPNTCWNEGGRNEKEIQQAVREKLRQAVESHLVSDVPVGVFLSGGVDSSAIVALMSQMGQGRFSTFSVGFQGVPNFTELPFAKKVATQFGTSHRELEVGPKDLVATLPTIVGHLDEPLTDPALVPTYLLSKMAGAYVKVVLSGEGADELFGGYRRYSLDWLASWYQQVPTGVRTRMLDWFRKSSVDRKVVQGVRALTQDSPAKRHMEWVGAFSFEELCEVTKSPEAVEAEAHRLEALFEPYFTEGGDQAAAVAGMLRADLSTWLPDDLLTKVDRMTMAASLEARVPYLDHPLVEMVADIPARMKFKDGVSKAVLKTAVGDLLPKEIVTRRKMGFDVPLAQWIRGPMKDFMVEVLRSEGPPGLLNPAGVKRYLHEHLEGKQDRSRQLWSLAVVTLWFQSAVKAQGAASSAEKAA